MNLNKVTKISNNLSTNEWELYEGETRTQVIRIRRDAQTETIKAHIRTSFSCEGLKGRRINYERQS